jgi:fructose PTS system EIIBC or EIIC component
MANIIAVVACPTGIAHTHMAAEALKKSASQMGHHIRVETRGSAGADSALSTAEIAAADVVIIASDIHLEMNRFLGKQIYSSSTSDAIVNTKQLINAALSLIGQTTEEPTQMSNQSRKKIVAITACPTGIAHTFMAAEALKKWAVANNCDMKVETQGSVGAKNILSEQDIAEADLVLIGADTHVDVSRFNGKPVYKTSVGRALKETNAVLKEAFSAPLQVGTTSNTSSVKTAKSSGAYKHLLTGVSYMLPLVVAGGLIIALSFIFGIEAFKEKGTLAAALMSIGGGAAFALMIPVLAGFIAYSIADRPGLAPGLIGGMLASQLQAGFLGGILAGFFAGYVARWLSNAIKLPVNFEGLKPVLIIPLLSTLAVGLFMIYVVGEPAKALMDGLTQFLTNMGTANAVILGLLLGGMMAIDMGGPINKASYTFGVGLLASNSYLPMAAIMAGGMVPPLALALATMVAKNRFTADEIIAGKAAGVLGLSFITEGAIPFAANDPIRVLPSCVAGAALTGALSMYFGCMLHAPHGGIFVLAIPNAVSPLLPYVFAIVAGTLLSTLLLVLLKKPIKQV